MKFFRFQVECTFILSGSSLNKFLPLAEYVCIVTWDSFVDSSLFILLILFILYYKCCIKHIFFHHSGNLLLAELLDKLASKPLSSSSIHSLVGFFTERLVSGQMRSTIPATFVVYLF